MGCIEIEIMQTAMILGVCASHFSGPGFSGANYDLSQESRRDPFI